MRRYYCGRQNRNVHYHPRVSLASPTWIRSTRSRTTVWYRSKRLHVQGFFESHSIFFLFVTSDSFDVTFLSCMLSLAPLCSLLTHLSLVATPPSLSPMPLIPSCVLIHCALQKKKTDV